MSPSHPSRWSQSSCYAAVLCSCFPLAIRFTFGSVYMSMPLSHFIPAYPFPSPCPQLHSVHLRLYFCPAPRFIETICFFFRFPIYVLAYSICFSLSDLLHSHYGEQYCILYYRNIHLRRTVWRFLKKLKLELPYDPAIPLLGIYPGKTIIQTETCTTMFTAALFTIARTWKQPKCPSTDEWIKKMWHIYTMEYYSAIKRNEIELFVVR